MNKKLTIPLFGLILSSLVGILFKKKRGKKIRKPNNKTNDLFI